MNCSTMRISLIVSFAGSVLGYSPSMMADVGAVGRVVGKAATIAWSGIKKVVPRNPAVIAAMCIAGGMTAKGLWTRYVTLRALDEKINPHAMLYVDIQEHAIYNWMMGAPGFTTPGQIRANFHQVKQAIAQAAIAGQVDVYQYGTGYKLPTGHAIFWADVLASIDGELNKLRRWMRTLEPFVDFSVKGIHLFGIRRNFAAVCQDLGINGLDQMRHGLTVNQEAQVEAAMIEERGLCERTIAFLMSNPNYAMAHRMFWQIDQRLGRLEAIKEAVSSTPINWYAPIR